MDISFGDVRCRWIKLGPRPLAHGNRSLADESGRCVRSGKTPDFRETFLSAWRPYTR